MNETARPDPDALLQRLQAEEQAQRRGRLKVFFGANAGVGKTYAMLSAARSEMAQGRAVAVGLVETHGRTETEALLRAPPPLTVLPLKSLRHRDRSLSEFDLDAALAFGAANPGALLLLDELAHTNVPGENAVASRHPKRWQDVQELLASGLDVWTTLNVQHLDSLNDVVGGITGVRVWETVPDHVFDEADEVVVVDLPPDELLLRLRQGKVYRGAQAEKAAEHFFRKGNLLALRELALRRTADRVDGQMQAWRRQSAQQPVWANRESLLACVAAGDSGAHVVRSCARLAAQMGLPWHAVHVETLGATAADERRRQQTARVLELAQQLGATTALLSGPDLPDALLRYAREHNLSRLVLGRRHAALAPGFAGLKAVLAGHWRWPWRPSLAQAISLRADDIDVLQVAVRGASGTAGTARDSSTSAPAAATPASRRWPPYVAALASCALTAVLATPLVGVLELSNIVMLFLLTVVGVALFCGRGPAVLAAFVGVGLFDFFFVPPRFSFAVSDVQYLLTFAVMLVVALVVGQLTAGLKVQAEAATQRERRVRSLYEMARDLSSALLPEQVAGIGARFLRAEFGAACALLAADADEHLRALPGATAALDGGITSVAQWAYDRGEPAGRGTDTLPASAALVLPLRAPMRLRGVLVVEPARHDRTRAFGPEQRRLLDTCASLLAISLERIHYIEVAQSSTLQIESERLRNSLLSAISHDLRTPLAAMVGLADTLALSFAESPLRTLAQTYAQTQAQPQPQAEQREIAQRIRAGALRMNSLVNNLLDMARLESGAVQLKRQWQPLEEAVGSAFAAAAGVLAGRALHTQLAYDLPLLNLDAVLIERVLVNLFENAAKYTPAGTPVTVSARVVRDKVEISVDDEGPGLPAGREEALFEKFERGRKESATPGVGLGLAICRAIVQAHGGSIRGQTRSSGGARFTITLPRGEPPGDDGSGSADAARGVDDADGARSAEPVWIDEAARR